MPDSYFTLVAAITTTIFIITTPTASFVEEMMCGLVTDRKFVSWCQSHSKKVVVVCVHSMSEQQQQLLRCSLGVSLVLYMVSIWGVDGRALLSQVRVAFEAPVTCNPPFTAGRADSFSRAVAF